MQMVVKYIATLSPKSEQHFGLENCAYNTTSIRDSLAHNG